MGQLASLHEGWLADRRWVDALAGTAEWSGGRLWDTPTKLCWVTVVSYLRNR